MDFTTLGVALKSAFNQTKSYVTSHFKAGTNITITDNLDGTQTISASGEVSAQDDVARNEISEHKINKDNPHEVTAFQIGLGNVNNTADLDKPISTAVQTALNLKADITDIPTSASDVGALPNTTKYAKSLIATIDTSTFIMTIQLKDQDGNNLGTAQTIDLPLESVVVGGSYNDNTKKVVLTLQNGNTVEFSVADLVSGLQSELSASNKLDPSYINYDSTHRAVSDIEKTTWSGKQDALTTAQLNAVNSGIISSDVQQITINKNEIVDLVDNSAKNKLKHKSTGSQNINKVTFAINDDGVVVTTQSEVTTSYEEYYITPSGGITLPKGNYVAYVGGGTANTPFRVKKLSDDSVIARTTGSDGVAFTLTEDTVIQATITYLPNTTLEDTFYPMICSSTAWAISDKFVPYQPSTAELYEMIRAIE